MKKIPVMALAVILTVTTLLANVTPVLGRIPWEPYTVLVGKSLGMTNYQGHGTGEHDSTCEYGACGPSAGVSIGRYYRDQKGYGNLPMSNDTMYDVLYEEIPTFWCYTDSFYYGYGFVEMTIDPDQDNNTNDGYYNFGYVYDDDVTWWDFWNIVDAIENGWPIAVDGNFMYVNEISGDPGGDPDWPPQVGHWIAIRGYSYLKTYTGPGSYYTSNHRIICTDSYCRSDELVLDWGNLVANGMGLHTVIIKDEIPENFEWGNNGDSLDTSGGNVVWTVSASGSSHASISYVSHYSTKSGRLYRDGTNNVQGSYSEVRPIWRGFWLRKDSSAVFCTRTGDGSHSILVSVLDSASNYKLQYYYDGAWRDTGCSLTSNGTWYFIEFRAIHWDSPYKYDIFVDGNYVKGGVSMYVDSGYNGITAYYSESGSGSFYIDDISSSWW